MRQPALALAGATAIASGSAYVLYLLLPGQPDWLITAWNLLIIPTFVILGVRFAPFGPMIAGASTAAGVAASVLWAFDFERAAVEPWWIGLAAASWLGFGWLLRARHGRIAWFTLLLGVVAAVDLVVTLADAPQPWLAIGGLKIPLTNLWSFWIGAALVRASLTEREAPAVGPAAGPFAVAGGVTWAAGSVGWLLTHGSTGTNPSAVALLGLRGTEFTQLLIVATLLWAIALVAVVPRETARARIAWGASLVGVTMIGIGAVFETSILDPDLNFNHPIVQSGWLLFIGGLFPTLCAGMLAMAAWSRDRVSERAAYAAVGLAAPLPVVAFFMGGIATTGTGALVALALMHAAPGVGWVALGVARLRGARSPVGASLAATA